jgi:serine/threonine kinase PknH
LVIAVISGLSIWLLTRSDDDSGQASGDETTTTTSRTTAATTSNTTPPPFDANARLLSLLPKGYGPGVCVPENIDSTAVWHNALAIAQCGPPSDPGGPLNGLYALFPDAASLRDAFVKTTDTEKVQSVCPQGKASPGNWWDNDNPGVVLGQIECLLNGSSPEFEWTNTRQLVIGSIMGSAQGPTLDDLYTWWSKYS